LSKQAKKDQLRPLNRQTAMFFADQLRTARLAALAHAEAFDEIIHTVERLGSYIEGKQLTLGKYLEALTCLAGITPLAEKIPNQFRGLLTPFSELHESVRIARNDALHQGAFARHLTKHAIELAIVLEDALSQYKKPYVTDFMVRKPVCAELWQPVGFIRQQMLENSYSYLPVFDDGEQRPDIEKWSVVSDVAIAKYLRAESDGVDRNDLLAMTLHKAREEALIVLKATKTFDEDTALGVALDHLNAEHVLLVRGPKLGSLVGIITAFDLM
jgi:hypothetical protein